MFISSFTLTHTYTGRRFISNVQILSGKCENDSFYCVLKTKTEDLSFDVFFVRFVVSR